ncbi:MULTISPECIES: hypothetical protein [unclassified Brevibacterium]|uniref:hypothetical protein n=1 Tax=unclassified Brevibacterium TaxID=2614124 RepID=UPI00109238B2|nr:hypothetical protein [Brevibacterium sp. S22]TGD32703.1 hypothetical protein EB835_03255 [Brevibacterium sp. S22]
MAVIVNSLFRSLPAVSFILNSKLGQRRELRPTRRLNAEWKKDRRMANFRGTRVGRCMMSNVRLRMIEVSDCLRSSLCVVIRVHPPRGENGFVENRQEEFLQADQIEMDIDS